LVEDLKETPPPQAPPAKKGGMMKWLILGVAFLALTGLVAFGTVFFLGTDEAKKPEDLTPKDSTNKTTTTASTEVKGDSVQTEKKPNPMDEVMQNLAILDYKPGPTELTTKDGSMTIQDSVDAVVWISQEKEKLAQWKKQLEVRQQELDKLDHAVSQKLLKIEQVESARVAQLAKLYDAMQPPSIAQLMANLDDKTVVEILPKMNSKQASAVLALLPPIRAAKLSKQMMTIADKE